MSKGHSKVVSEKSILLSGKILLTQEIPVLLVQKLGLKNIDMIKTFRNNFSSKDKLSNNQVSLTKKQNKD